MRVGTIWHRLHTPRVTRFDRAYFDKWYRHPRHRISDNRALRRQASLAIAAAEYLLERPVRRVLDIGAGEGAWERAIRALRPRARYVGIDPSEYAVRRFGARRNVRPGSFGGLGAVRDLKRFDLVICADVLHYVEGSEVERGARVLGRRLRGVALLHAFTRDDVVEGDTSGYMDRSPAFYRRVFQRARLTEVGLGLWVARPLAGRIAALEAPG